MLTSYIQAAMRSAHYEILEDNQTFIGTIPGCDGVWSNEATLEECRQELQEALEDWILFRVSQNLPLPIIEGMDLSSTQEEVA